MNVWESLKRVPWYWLLGRPRKVRALWKISDAEMLRINVEFDQIFSPASDQAEKGGSK